MPPFSYAKSPLAIFSLCAIIPLGAAFHLLCFATPAFSMPPLDSRLSWNVIGKPPLAVPVAPLSSSFRRTPESPFAFYEIPAFAGMTGFLFG
ncbi:MAG: hypothetical protein ACR2P4_01005 [Gammaproteobacteria bacterium]